MNTTRGQISPSHSERGKTMTTVVKFTYQPLVRQESAEFTLDSTDWQVLSVKDWDGIRFSIRGVGGSWSPLGRFVYADVWAGDHGYPQWNRATFRAMIADFLDRGGE